MVKDFEKHERPDKPTFWSFRLVMTAWDIPCESTGWKYFPETDVIKPPAFKNSAGFWVPAFQEVRGDFLVRLTKAVKRALDLEPSKTEEKKHDPTNDRATQGTPGGVPISRFGPGARRT